MNIILLSQHFPPEIGAPQIRLYEVSKELQKRGHQVEVITAFPHHPHGIIPEKYKGKFYEKEKYETISVHRSWIYPSPKGSFWRRLISYFSFTFSAFYSVVKAKKADVIICNSPPLFLGITGYIASKMKKAKFVFNIADIWPESAVELGIVKNKTFIRFAERLEMFLYRKSWKLAAATEGIQSYLINKGKSKSDVFLLPNGVNTESFQPEAPNEAWTNKLKLKDKTVFTFAGRLGYAQGLDSILKAAKIVQEKNSTIQFLLVGDGPEKQNLVDLSRELGLTNTLFHDSVPVTEMPKVFSITDYSIVSLRNLELFKGARPSKIFPALSTATPVLYCGAGESAQFLENEKCGIIAEPENVEDIAMKILESASLPEVEKKLLGNNGRQFVLREYSWQTIVDDLLLNLKQ
ncbi:glycosyltransferase family 4 protein [Guptibacillus sedimenti]|uniref:glycosyltransferase family 4 protein n=1 Tax=Guptibacillus sedimenti TaxID=3025680 RepID=UPI00235F2512|nr:glycosyltransferase family 4 protein [Pseudalkalibacillus sedimenti]